MKGIWNNFIFSYFILLIMLKMSFAQNNNSTNNTNNNANSTSVTCQKTQYTSMFTMCQVNFDFCNQTSFKFLNCFKKQCQRYVRASECKLWTRIQLTENQCYKQCCGSSNFSEISCNQYNNKKEDNQSSINGIIVAIIVISAVILVSVAAYLLIKVQKCCQKRQITRISRYNVVWRSQKVLDSTCQICKNYGASIETPCKHFFHATCFQQNAKTKHVPLCPKCQQPIKQRIKIACMGCKQKMFKARLWKIDQLSEIIREGRAVHEEVCSVSTKSDDLLLSPIKL